MWNVSNHVFELENKASAVLWVLAIGTMAGLDVKLVGSEWEMSVEILSEAFFPKVVRVIGRVPDSRIRWVRASHLEVAL